MSNYPKRKPAQRRAGQVGQIDLQGRSHDAADCGTYRLLRNVGAGQWEVEWIGSCDDRYTSTLHFISRQAYSRYF